MSYIGKKPVDFNDVTEAQTFTVTGDLTVDTSTLKVDSTNNRVGILEASPTVPLEVKGAQGYASSASNLSTSTTKAAAKIRGSSDASTSLFFGSLTNDAEQYIQSANGAGSAADDLALNPFGGNVGVGLVNPDTPLEVQIGSSGNALKLSSSSDGASVFLAFEHQESGTKHVRGRIRAASNGVEGGLIFETGASSSTSERMRILNDGAVLVGTTTSGGSGGVTLRNDGVMIAPAVYGTVVSASLRDIQMDSSGFFGYSTSTRATKGNIEDLSDVSWLYNLNPISFNRKVFDRETNTFKDELSPETEYGLIAEDVEAVNKNLCFYNETEDGQELAGITYSKLITPLIKALQEANAKIKTLEAKVTALENA
jgi:hypothetical protein